MNRSLGSWKLPQPTDLKDEEQKNWTQIPRITRIVPFGYKINDEDNDLLDPIPGYIKGAKLEMFNLELRQNLNASKTRIQSFRLIDIASLSPRDELVTPISWYVSTCTLYTSDAADE